MDLENVIKRSRRYKNKYDGLVKDLEICIYNQKQDFVKKVISDIIDIDKEALIKRISIWKGQLDNVRTNNEYDYVAYRIKIGEAVLNAL